MRLILPIVLVFCAACASAQTRIIDGDTIEVASTVYRLNGIDAPEVGQQCNTPAGSWNCGKAAVEEIASIAEGKAVLCEAHSQDGYGRTIATCYVEGTDLGAQMVRAGYAWAFTKYSDVYVKEEMAAKRERLGVWQGNSTPPWEYRAQRWARAEQEAPKGCPIKGNISRNGKIYHPPWSPWYSKTRINENKGERWFCSEAEARLAGWRAPRWR